MTTRLVWHVGTPKSGTTYLQSVLRQNRERLAEAGWLVAGETHLDLVRSGMAVREDPGLSRLPERAQRSWDRVVQEILDWPGEAAVLSYELFAGASEDQIRRARARFGDLQVSVVVTARELGGVVSSAWQERLKFGLDVPLGDWEPRPEGAGPAAQWSWRTLDPASVGGRWQVAVEHPADVHLVTVPVGGPPQELWRRFAEASGLEVSGLSLAVAAANESLSPVRAEVLRRVNALVADRFPTPREASVWLRDTLAHRVLARGGEEKPGLSDAQFQQIQERARHSGAALAASSWVIHGDLADLEPRQPDGRLPGDVPEDEIARVAVEALAQLLVDQRDQQSKRTVAAAPGPAPDEPPASLMTRVRREGAARLLARLDRRLGELEEQVRASRRLHLRVAELEDLVAELLVVSGDVDDAALRRALATYRKQSV